MYLLKEIEKYANGRIINGDPETRIKEYSLSKEDNQSEKFFIPILFKNIDREQFIMRAVKNRAVGFMINKNSEQYDQIVEEAKRINSQICIIEVEDVNQSLYQLGLESRKRNREKPIIAVTGSVGKTTLCGLISSVLKTEIKVLHDFKNQNNNTKWHVSHTLLHFENDDMAVIELGISDKGIMTQLSKLIEPSIAVIHQIGMAHLNKLETKEKILEEKLHITDYIKDKKILFVNTDNEYLQTVKESDAYEVYQISYENIVKAIHEFQPVDGRLKILKDNKKDIIVIDDTYSCWSIEAVKLGLKTANQIKSQRRIAVLGRMEALGEQATMLHEKLGEFFEQLGFDYLYTTGGYKKYLCKGALKAFPEEQIKKFKTTEKLMLALEKNIKEGDLIYMKAANRQCFDRIIENLKEKYELK